MGCHTCSRVFNWLSHGKEQTMKLQCLEATDSNGTELYLFQLEDNSFISVPKRTLEFKPLSPEELKEMKGADDEM